MTDTLTIRLLDREVVLTRNCDLFESYVSSDKAYWFGRYPSGLCVARCRRDCVDARGQGDSKEEAVADLDTKLRRLREWLR